MELPKFKNGEVPAFTIQTIFLGANFYALLHGATSPWILISLTLIVILFSIQIISGNPRFIYLFPVNMVKPEKTSEPVDVLVVKTPALDTWMLRFSILFTILCFYIGITVTAFGVSLSIALALSIIIMLYVFWVFWDKIGNELVQKTIKDNVSQIQGD